MQTFEIAPHYDRWMMGDRLGDLVKYSKARTGPHKGETIAHLKMHVSGKVIRVLADDLTLR
jgi:hypothetical protein